MRASRLTDFFAHWADDSAGVQDPLWLYRRPAQTAHPVVPAQEAVRKIAAGITIRNVWLNSVKINCETFTDRCPTVVARLDKTSRFEREDWGRWRRSRPPGASPGGGSRQRISGTPGGPPGSAGRSTRSTSPSSC